MKMILIIVGVIVLLIVGYIFLATDKEVVPAPIQNDTTASTTTPVEQAPQGPVSVTPISHATALLAWGGELILTDPVGDEALYRGKGEPSLILLTDIHSDHLSTTTLAALVGSSTEIVAPKAVADLLPKRYTEQTTVLDNGATTSQKGFAIEAIPMYNLPEATDSRHVKGRGNGYVIERDGTRVYVAGDTGDIKEMRELKDIDIAFIPMNLPFTMSVEKAAEAVIAFAPRTVYPYHYRGEDGLSDVEQFRNLVNTGNPRIKVELQNWYPSDTQEAN